MQNMSNVNVNLTFETETDLRCTYLQTMRGIQFRGQGQSGVIPGTFHHPTESTDSDQEHSSP